MAESGLFITLYDEDTLRLYLARGIYGFLMNPTYGEVSSRSMHFKPLADYACSRQGTHVFFFLRRKVIYGGQIQGGENSGAFYLNGADSPLGRDVNAPIVWDESARDRYQATDQPGYFHVRNRDNEYILKCQPYLLQFEDQLGLIGHYIISDQLYWTLGKYGYPLPSNSIQGMSFCTMTPAETSIAIDLLRTESQGEYSSQSDENIVVLGQPQEYSSVMGIQDLFEAFTTNAIINEAHLEASIIANPKLLPEGMRPGKDMAICRQVPLCPFKPYQLDRADFCYYQDESALPNAIIELKARRANNAAIRQVESYVEWVLKVSNGQVAGGLRAYVLAPSFTGNSYIRPEYRDCIELISILDD